MTISDELLTRYADDPTSLSAAERAAVEAVLAEGDPATETAVRTLPSTGTPPDWRALEERIFAATTRAPRGRRWALAAGAVALAAAAVALVALRAPTGRLPTIALPTFTPPPPAVAMDAPREEPVVVVDDDASDLDGLGPVDDELADELSALDDEELDSDDELPAIGATWTSWLDDFSDAQLDRALVWLDSEEAS